MKKIFILLLLPIFLIGVVGCGSETTKKEEKKESQTENIEDSKNEVEEEINELQQFINSQEQYGEKVKVVNELNDLNATNAWKSQYSEINSIENMQKYAELLRFKNFEFSSMYISELTEEEIVELFVNYFAIFVDENYGCYELELANDQIYKLYDYKLDKIVDTIYTKDNYYCSYPGGGTKNGSLTKDEYNFDGTYHIYDYEWTNTDGTIEKSIIKFIEKDGLYKLYSIE